MEFIETPKCVTCDDLIKKKSLSPSNYKLFNIKNKNKIQLRKLIIKIKSGKEVGSKEYIKTSNKFFIRTKALQTEYLLLDSNSKSILPIKPVSFKKLNLKTGEILITKDSNVGEVVYLEKDYPDFTLSAGIKSLSIQQNKHYVLAFLKSEFFKEQLNLLISRGSTIKHAKEKFLECYIPYPSTNKNNTIEYISKLMESWIQKEIKIRKNFEKINELVEKELNKTQKKCKHSFDYPTYEDIKKSKRLDVGVYNPEYRQIINLIQNYPNGFFNIPENKFKSGSTPKKRIIGKGFINWITPTFITPYGYLINNEKIICDSHNIKKDCIIIINRTSKEGIGEYVGITTFYDYLSEGIAQHNQGGYRVEDYLNEDLKLIALLLNSRYYRKLCGYISLGSKMKEIKIKNLIKIPFPKFQKNLKTDLIKCYSNKQKYPTKLDLKNFSQEDYKVTENSGILELARQINQIKSKIESLINDIANCKKINITFDFFR